MTELPDELQIYELLFNYFDNNEEKVEAWLTASNIGMFGGTSAALLIFFGREHKVLAAIKAAMEGY